VESVPSRRDIHIIEEVIIIRVVCHDGSGRDRRWTESKQQTASQPVFGLAGRATAQRAMTKAFGRAKRFRVDEREMDCGVEEMASRKSEISRLKMRKEKLASQVMCTWGLLQHPYKFEVSVTLGRPPTPDAGCVPGRQN
jgi:hypothetical protein